MEIRADNNTNTSLLPEISTIQAFAQLSATSLDLDDLLQAGLEILYQAFHFDILAIMLVADKTDELILKAYYGDYSTTQFLSTLNPLITQVFETKSTLKQNFTQSDLAISLRSCLIIPLTIGRLLIGQLVIGSRQTDDYSHQEEQLLTIFASQITVAVNNARLYSKTRENQQQELIRRQIATHLQNLSTIINATLDLDDVLQLILEHIEGVIPYSSALVMLLDSHDLIVEAAANFGPGVHFAPIKAGQGIIFRQVLLQQYPAVYHDITENKFWKFERADFMQDIRAWIGAPLVIKHKIIGLLTLHHKEAGYFDHADLDLIHTFANQAAIAIDNAQLYQREQQKVKQFQIVAKIGHQITEIYEVQPLLNTVVKQLHQDLGYQFVSIFLYQPHQDKLVLTASNDMSPEQQERKNIQISLQTSGVIATVARTHEPILVNDVKAFEGYYCPTGRELVQSELAIPLMSKGRLVGVLDLQSIKPYAFMPDDLILARTVANQVAIGIETKILFEDQIQRLTELTTFEQIGHSLREDWDENYILKIILEKIEILYQVEHVRFMALESQTLSLRLAFNASSEITIDQKLPLTLMIGEGISGWVAQYKKSVMIEDVQADSRYDDKIDLMTQVNPKKLLAVPVQNRDYLFGVIEIINRLNGQAFAPDDKIILEFVASTLALMLDNIRLCTKLKQTSKRMTDLKLVEPSQN